MLYAIKDINTGLNYDGQYRSSFFTEGGRAFKNLAGLKQSLTGYLVQYHWKLLDAEQQEAYIQKAVIDKKARYDAHNAISPSRWPWNEEQALEVAKSFGGAYTMWDDIKHKPLVELLPPHWKLIEINI